MNNLLYNCIQYYNTNVWLLQNPTAHLDSHSVWEHRYIYSTSYVVLLLVAAAAGGSCSDSASWRVLCCVVLCCVVLCCVVLCCVVLCCDCVSLHCSVASATSSLLTMMVCSVGDRLLRAISWLCNRSMWNLRWPLRLNLEGFNARGGRWSRVKFTV